MTHSTLRFVVAALLLASAAIFLRREPPEELPHHLPLRLFPLQIGPWRGTDVPIPQDDLVTLGHGDFLRRNYQNEEQTQPSAELFIAFFSSQRAGDTIHSPRNCLTAEGWTPIESSRMVFTVPGHTSFPVNRYIIARRDSRKVVLYWYWAHDRGVASEYLAKYYLVADSIRMHRSDGGMIRVSTEIYRGETADAAEQRILPFAVSLVPLLNSYIPQ